MIIDYEDFNPAPDNLEELYHITIALFKQYPSFPRDVENLHPSIKLALKPAIINQINYLVANEKVLDYSSLQGFSISKFSKQGVSANDIRTVPLHSPIAIILLGTLGYASTVVV